MTYGDNSARAVRFQPRTGTIGPQDIIKRGQAAEEELYGGQGPTTPKLPQDMQIIQGITDDVRKQWSALEDFAQTMWKNYRIDVTKPDTRNELSMKAHDQYQQGLSGVMYTADALKQGHERLGKYNEAFLQGHGYLRQDPNTTALGLESPQDSFVNTQQDPRATQFNQYLAGGQETQGASGRANQLIQKKGLDPLQDQIDEARASGQEGLAQNLEAKKSQFAPAFYDPETFAPRAPKGGLDRDQAKNLYDQITNYKIGILNNDKGMIGTIKNTFPGILDIRPVNTGNKSGAYITRKAGDKTVTSFVDFSEADLTQGNEALFYMLQTANPNKFKVDPNEFMPYLQHTKYTGFTPSKNNLSFDDLAMKFKHLNSMDDSVEKLKNGKSITVSEKDKQGFIDTLDKLAIKGDLKMPDGTDIINIEWKGGGFKNAIKGLFGAGDTPKVVIDLASSEEPLVLDPSDPNDQEQFKQILEMNSQDLIDPAIWEKSKTPYINSQMINPEKGSNVDVNKQGQARSIVEQFEALKKQKK